MAIGAGRKEEREATSEGGTSEEIEVEEDEEEEEVDSLDVSDSEDLGDLDRADKEDETGASLFPCIEDVSV
jgi:hypothetical protein